MNLIRLKKTIFEETQNNLEMTKKLLMTLGYDERAVKMMDKGNFHKLLENATSISSTEKYIKVESDGRQSIMEPELCKKEAKKLEDKKDIRIQQNINQLDTKNEMVNNTKGRSSYTGNGNSASTDDSDTGYMRIITSAFYVDSAYSVDKKPGNYLLGASFEWLSTPSTRFTDALSIGDSNIIWSANNENFNADFECTSTLYTQQYPVSQNPQKIVRKEYYSKTGVAQGCYNNNSLMVNNSGVYCGWELPRDVVGPSSTYYSDFIFSISAVGTVKRPTDPIPTGSMIISAYKHLESYIKIEPSISFGMELEPQVSFTSSYGFTELPFYSRCPYTYDSNLDLKEPPNYK